MITILGLVYTYTSISVSLFDPCIIHVRWVFLNKTSNIHTVTLQTQICQHHNMYFKFTFTNDASNTDKCVHLRHRFQKSCLSSRKHWKWHFWKPLPWSFQKAQFSVASNALYLCRKRPKCIKKLSSKKYPCRSGQGLSYFSTAVTILSHCVEGVHPTYLTCGYSYTHGNPLFNAEQCCTKQFSSRYLNFNMGWSSTLFYSMTFCCFWAAIHHRVETGGWEAIRQVIHALLLSEQSLYKWFSVMQQSRNAANPIPQY